MIKTFFSPLGDEILFLLNPEGYKARLLQLLNLAAEPWEIVLMANVRGHLFV